MYVDSWNSSIVQKHVGDMTLIEGVGDEVTHFFIAVFIIVIGKLAHIYFTYTELKFF